MIIFLRFRYTKNINRSATISKAIQTPIPHPEKGIIFPLPKYDKQAIPNDLEKRAINKKSLNFISVMPANIQIISSGKKGKNNVKNSINFVLEESSFSYFSTFSLPKIQYKIGFEQNLPIKNASIEPNIIPIVAKTNAKNGPKIAVPARIVTELGNGTKVTCKKLIIV